MANTVTNTLIQAGISETIYYFTLVSDGAEETDLVIYDSSVVATALGIDDPLTSRIVEIQAEVSAAATARVKLEFDATTDVLALNLPANVNINHSFRHTSFLRNYAGAGITGDITITTTGLESGDLITIVLTVKPK